MDNAFHAYVYITAQPYPGSRTLEVRSINYFHIVSRILKKSSKFWRFGEIWHGLRCVNSYGIWRMICSKKKYIFSIDNNVALCYFDAIWNKTKKHKSAYE